MRQARKPKRGLVFRLRRLLLMIIVAVLAYQSILIVGDRFRLAQKQDDKPAPVAILNKRMASSAAVSGDSLYSRNAILVRLDDRNILMEKQSAEKIYPASLTKIMTAMVALENLPDLHEEILLSDALFRELNRADATMAGFQADEQVKALDLLYGVMLPSGAECCIGLANHIAGSESQFVKMMNQRAVDLGMYNTHFINATGLHDEDHYTTVKDLAILVCYALQDDTFRKIFTSPRYSTGVTNKHPHGITFNNTMFERLADPGIIGGQILGGKTGYTDMAGLCLASLAESDGKEYVLLTAGAKGDHKTEQYNITDALAVFNSLGEE